MLAPPSASAQSITTVPAVAVPAMPPTALLALWLLLIAGGVWVLRTRPDRRISGSMLSFAVAATLLWYGPALRAAITSSFTNPAGQTRSIPVTQIPSGSDLAGWELADFTNTSGASLTVDSIVLPTFSQCLPGGLSGSLLPAGAPPPSPPQTCAAGLTLHDGDTCRVDVDSTCRGLVSGLLATLSSVSPTSGSTAGGTPVTLTGTNLTGATGVTFGGTAATAVTVVNATTVTATTPAHAAGAVDVVITTPGGTATLTGGFTYQGPIVLSATPNPLLLIVNGPAGAMTITNISASLTGFNVTSNFTGTALDGNVTETGNTCASMAPGVSCTLTFTPGNTVVPQTSFTIVGSNTNTLSAAIAIESGSTLTAGNPNAGTAAGGVGVTLTGTGLTGATAVTFDGVPATSLNVVSSTTVMAVTPAHAAGAVDVVIDTPAGGAVLANGFTYVTTAVGQASGGGTIAALGGGLNNLIAATADNSAGIEWGGFGTNTNAQSDADGSANTAAVIVALGNNGGVPYAAQVCSTYEIDSQGNTPCQAGNACYNDWFLAAKNQLNELFTNRAAIGGFASVQYWSSTEAAANPTLSAWGQFFGTGAQGIVDKSLVARVRCVRPFTP